MNEGVRVLLTTCCIALLCASCAGSAALDGDSWGIRRRFDGATPSIMSISDINGGTPKANGAIQSLPIRSRVRAGRRVSIAAQAGIAPAWAAGAALFDPQLEHALDWLGLIATQDHPDIELRLTLMPDHGARHEQRLHPAAAGIVIDLLLPVPAQPRSRSAVLDQVLATGLHEAAHVLRPRSAHDRDDDEYRASLVAACFRLEGSQRGDRINLGATRVHAPREFTRQRSATAAQAVQHDLASVLGQPSMRGDDHAGIKRLLAFCMQRLAKPTL